MKKIILGVLVLYLVLGISAQEFTTLTGYYKSLDVKCSSNDDCLVKNIENCCGYYPKCINKTAILNPEIVRNLCNERNETCHNIVITYCRCQGSSSSNKKCVGFYGKPENICGDGHCYKNESLKDNKDYCPEDCEIDYTKKETIVVEENQSENNLSENEESQAEDEIQKDIKENSTKVKEKNGSGWGVWIVFIIAVIVLIATISYYFLRLNKKTKKEV
ncbi:hypothetical protein GF386_01800 [Candidatus Pacearchaeota archaeon]|nr:hypothetical protein [Candidatus Pacearchaeota archaeon]MBD3282913.1 hypothetical protein [Candidatus Pacearchaeota archaeon]